MYSAHQNQVDALEGADIFVPIHARNKVIRLFQGVNVLLVSTVYVLYQYYNMYWIIYKETFLILKKTEKTCDKQYNI